MSNWTHACCNLCWLAREGERIPVRVRESEETCCFCGDVTESGIFVREDPNSVRQHCPGHDDL